MKITNIAIIGYGEVGGIFARGLLGQSGVGTVTAWDQKFVDQNANAGRRAALPGPATEPTARPPAPGRSQTVTVGPLAVRVVTEFQV